jgi:cell division protein ZipA
MDGRELLILLLGLATAAVLLRGLFVALQSRRGQIKLAIDKNIPQDIDLDALELSELPGGGARVVERSLQKVNRENSAVEAATIRAEAIDLGVTRPASRGSTTVRPNTTASSTSSRSAAQIPVLMDAVELSVRPQEDYHTQEEVAFDYSGEAGDHPAEQAAMAPHLLEDSVADSQHDEEIYIGEGVEEEYLEETSEEEVGFGEEDGFEAEGDSEEETESDDESVSLAIDTMNQVTPDYPDEDVYDDEDEINEAETQIAHESFENQENEIEGTKDLATEDELVDSEHGFGASTNPPQLGGFEDEDDFTDGNDYQDEEDLPDYENLDEEVDEGQEPEQEQEDEMAGFSMTAGDRIGVAEDSIEQNATQGESLSDEEFESEIEAKSPRKSFLSWFARKPAIAESEELIEEEEFDDPLTSEVPIEEPVEDDPLLDIAPPPLAPEIVIHEPEINIPRETVNEIETTERSEVIVLNVMAPNDSEFHGTDLMHVLITAGLKFGEMSIFHQRVNGDNKAPVVFSVANILNPGSFDLNTMDNFYTRGVSLFLALPTPMNNLQAFDQMLDVAQQICGSLDGELKDDHRSDMTLQTIEHYRQRINDFELCRLKAVNSRRA